ADERRHEVLQVLARVAHWLDETKTGVGNLVLAVTAGRADDERASHLAEKLDVVALPAEFEAETVAGLDFAIVFDKRSGNADVQDESACVSHLGQNGLRESQALK